MHAAVLQYGKSDFEKLICTVNSLAPQENLLVPRLSVKLSFDKHPSTKIYLAHYLSTPLLIIERYSYTAQQIIRLEETESQMPPSRRRHSPTFFGHALDVRIHPMSNSKTPRYAPIPGHAPLALTSASARLLSLAIPASALSEQCASAFARNGRPLLPVFATRFGG